MKDTYLSAFGLDAPPFSKEIGDKDLWLPSSKTAVVDELVGAVEERASVLLTGEPGVGKTCVLRALRARLPAAGFRLTYCHNATLARRDFYRHLCMALGLSPHATAAAVFYNVETHVEDLAKERIHPVFLIDEAHLLHEQMLGHLHILLNYEWDSKALLSLILVGLPELKDQLQLRRYRDRPQHRHAEAEMIAVIRHEVVDQIRRDHAQRHKTHAPSRAGARVGAADLGLRRQAAVGVRTRADDVSGRSPGF